MIEGSRVGITSSVDGDAGRTGQVTRQTGELDAVDNRTAQSAYVARRVEL